MDYGDSETRAILEMKQFRQSVDASRRGTLTIPCPDCGLEILREAVACPHCGRFVPPLCPRPSNPKSKIRAPIPKSKLIPCPDCGRAISREAVACPRCGRFLGGRWQFVVWLASAWFLLRYFVDALVDVLSH
jgi:predicted amidophosphoribosyltransferase